VSALSRWALLLEEVPQERRRDVAAPGMEKGQMKGGKLGTVMGQMKVSGLVRLVAVADSVWCCKLLDE